MVHLQESFERWKTRRGRIAYPRQRKIENRDRPNQRNGHPGNHFWRSTVRLGFSGQRSSSPFLRRSRKPGGLGWLEGFNEWMVRCGLEFAGHPGKDQFVDNTGNKATLDLTLHGKIQNIPASEYEVVVDPEPPHRIRIRGTVYESFFYGPKLKLVTEVSTIPGSEEFQISDKITNQGSSIQEFQIIYHGNYGSSILEKGAMVYAPASSITPMNQHAAKSIESWQTYRGPTEGFIEEVFLLKPLADINSFSSRIIDQPNGRFGNFGPMESQRTTLLDHLEKHLFHRGRLCNRNRTRNQLSFQSFG